MKRRIVFIGMILLTLCSFGQLKVTTCNVYFRTSPEIAENKICLLPKGTVVNLVQDTVVYENWYRINYKGETGFVHNDYIDDPCTDKKNYNTTSDDEIKHYRNSNDKEVQSPTYYDSAPAGASAECNDGTYSFSQSRRGTCSHHGGVKSWL